MVLDRGGDDDDHHHDPLPDQRKPATPALKTGMKEGMDQAFVRLDTFMERCVTTDAKRVRARRSGGWSVTATSAPWRRC